MNHSVQNSTLCMAFTALSDLAQAQVLAKQLVSHKLAACVSITPQISSTYCWEGEITQSQEVQLMIKTSPQLISKIDAFFEQNHPYEVPELFSCNIEQGSASYLQWLSSNLEIS